MVPRQHVEAEGYQHETRVEGGWGGNDMPNSVVTRAFFGYRKLCHCAECAAKRGDDDIERLIARGLVAP